MIVIYMGELISMEGGHGTSSGTENIKNNQWKIVFSRRLLHMGEKDRWDLLQGFKQTASKEI